MEVASPLPFGQVTAGNKRRFCSPLVDPAMPIDAPMDESHADPYGQTFKRRRCDNAEMSHSPPSNTMSSPFGQQCIGNKRSRHFEDAHSHETTTNHLQSIIDRQTVDLQKLRQERASIETSFHELSSSHEKSQNENKVLKKVLAIKQERQEHFISELDGARRYKEQAEQLIAVLRQHLQAQQSHENASMGFNSGPPNVF